MTTSRLEATEQLLHGACIEQGFFITGDHRVSETDAAALLGLAAGSLKNMRSEGSGPPAYRLGLNGNRISYRLADLAAWIEGAREDW